MVSTVLDVVGTLLSVEFGIDEVVQRAVLLKELLVVGKVDAREHSLKEVLPGALVNCLLQNLLFVL